MPALAFAFIGLLWGIDYAWVGLVVVSVSFLLRRWLQGYFSLSTPFDVPIALFLVAAVMGVLVSPSWEISLGAFQSFLACVLLYYTLVNISRPSFIKWGFALAGLGVAAAFLLGFKDGVLVPPLVASLGDWVHKLTQHFPQVPQPSEVVNPVLDNAYGIAMAVEVTLIPLIGIILFALKALNKVAAILLSGLLLTILLLIGSQGAWLAVGVAVLFLLFCWSRWSLLPTSAALAIGYWGFRHRWFDPHTFLFFHPDGSLTGRVPLWREAIGIIQQHPITGCGLGCLSQYSSDYTNPHNAYLQLYSDMGIVGAIAFVYALVVLFKMGLKMLSSSRVHPWYGFAVGILAAILAISIHAIFETSPVGILAEGAGTYYYIASPIFWVLAGLLVRSKRVLEIES
jgi:O-antigen ligase